MSDVRIKRVYDEPSPEDDFRVLVDRLWPRGLRKEAAAVDLWAKNIAPSTELRQWYGRDPAKFEEMRRRYLAELGALGADIDEIVGQAKGRTITLLYASRETEHNHAIVLRPLVEQRLRQ